jgi:hypothetical protein
MESSKTLALPVQQRHSNNFLGILEFDTVDYMLGVEQLYWSDFFGRGSLAIQTPCYCL